MREALLSAGNSTLADQRAIATLRGAADAGCPCASFSVPLGNRHYRRCVRDQIRTTAGGSAAPNTPAAVLDGVDVWVPDWNTVLAELDADVAAYQKATGN